jgi:hypothetical protein
VQYDPILPYINEVISGLIGCDCINAHVSCTSDVVKVNYSSCEITIMYFSHLPKLFNSCLIWRGRCYLFNYLDYKAKNEKIVLPILFKVVKNIAQHCYSWLKLTNII